MNNKITEQQTSKEINFSKMNGLGNDFMVVDATSHAFSLSDAEIARLGDRKTGIGFDQLLVVEPAQNDGTDFNYRIFNTDGTEVEHCGNGARCFAKFVKDKQLTDKTKLTVKVKKGIITTNYHDDDHIEVDMAVPILKPADVPFNFEPNEYQPSYTLDINGEKITASVLSMGNPHVVLFVEDLWEMDIEPLGQAIQNSDYFPNSVNVNFVEMIDAMHIELRTYERGVGETDACGTGACASAFATAEKLGNQQEMLNSKETKIAVKVRGGDITIRIDSEKRIFMTGAARHVFDGVVTVTSIAK